MTYTKNPEIEVDTVDWLGDFSALQYSIHGKYFVGGYPNSLDWMNMYIHLVWLIIIVNIK